MESKPAREGREAGSGERGAESGERDEPPISPDRLFFFRCWMASVSAGKRHSRIRVLLPEPLTPVSNTKRASGKLTVRSFRLFLLASAKVSQLLSLAAPLDFGLWTLDFGLTARRFPRVG